MSAIPRGGRPRALAGFTLVELMVVMVILALLAGVTVPALLATGRRQDDDLTDAVRRLEGLFRLARDSAIRGGTAVTVVMDSATHLVWLVPDVSPTDTISTSTSGLGGTLGTAPMAADGPARDGAISLLDEGTSLEISPTVELRLGQARARFVFLPTGATMGDSIVVARAGDLVRITLDPWTGDVVAR
jgi:prepilin-type N-terminal cleavage/methylation domain-containing protein